MGTNCNNLQEILNQNRGCHNVNNTAVIIASIIALILINILDEETTDCIGAFLQAIGELMQLGLMRGCFDHLGNNCCYHYY